MKNAIAVCISLALSPCSAEAQEPASFNTQWITASPEVCTYKSVSNQGEGLYQVSVSKMDSVIEIYVNIISSGFTKTVAGMMTAGMRPMESSSKVIVNSQIIMNTQCKYEADHVTITTRMLPLNRTTSNSPSFSSPVVDFSQIPLLLRTLTLKRNSVYAFTGLNPRMNTLAPLTLRVLGEDMVKNIPCFKVEVKDFEGESIYWIEKERQHRVIRIEQPSDKRVTELMI